MSDTPDEVVLVHLSYLRQKMDEVVDHMRTQNGKLETHGNRLAVLEDRASEARNTGARWGAFMGGIITAIAAIWQALKGS